jgi:hypothetical protein
MTEPRPPEFYPGDHVEISHDHFRTVERTGTVVRRLDTGSYRVACEGDVYHLHHSQIRLGKPPEKRNGRRRPRA